MYVWHTGHQINEAVSMALHAGIPDNILKHTEWADNYFSSINKRIAIGYGILRGTGDIFKHNRIHDIDYYEVDRGYINPNHFDGYYRISKNALQAKYNSLEFPSDRLGKLKIDRQEWFNPKGQIIICPPTEYIENYYGHKNGWWLSEIEAALKDIKKSIIIRNKLNQSPLEQQLKDAYCVITFNSNVAVDAAIKGIPVITGAYSIVGKWCKNSIQDVIDAKIEPRNSLEVDKLLRFISYNQFTLEEIRNGTAWRLLHEE